MWQRLLVVGSYDSSVLASTICSIMPEVRRLPLAHTIYSYDILYIGPVQGCAYLRTLPRIDICLTHLPATQHLGTVVKKSKSRGQWSEHSTKAGNYSLISMSSTTVLFLPFGCCSSSKSEPAAGNQI